MGYPTRLSDAIHILLYIYVNPRGDLSSAAIADSVSTHPSYVRQLMSALRKGGLLECSQGRAQPALTRPVEQITLLDVYHAVEGDKPLLHQDTNTNPDCGVGVCVRNAVRECYDEIQRTAEHAMDALSLQDVMDRFRCDGDCRCDPSRCPCAGRCSSPTCGAKRTEYDQTVKDQPGEDRFVEDRFVEDRFVEEQLIEDQAVKEDRSTENDQSVIDESCKKQSVKERPENLDKRGTQRKQGSQQ